MEINMTEKKVTPEKRMELARYIREENMGNRVKLRQREHILYGRDPNIPTDERRPFSDAAPAGGMQGGEVPGGNPMGSFKYRMTLAVLLFVGFLLCDTGKGSILSYSTNDVYEMIRADSLHLYDGGENAVMEELAALFHESVDAGTASSEQAEHTDATQ